MPKETEKAFQAFELYRDMGEKRTLQAVADKLQKSYTLIRRWKDTWNWMERVRAYDNDLQKKAHASAVSKARKMADRHITIALKLQDAAVKALERTEVEDLDPKSLLAFIRFATELERQNRNDVIRMTEVKDETAAGPASLADAITAAWEKRQGEQ